jgi:protein-serine/threonine kinase
VDAATDDGQTALHLAALSGQPFVVQELLEKKANVNFKTGRGSTALQIASQCGDVVTAKLLLSFRANVACETNEKNQAIHLAAANGHTEVIEVLLASDGVQQLSSRNLYGQRPAEVAVDIETARFLQLCGNQAGAVEPNSRPLHLRGGAEDCYAKRTPFCEAVLLRNARADVVQRLLRMTTSLQDVGVESADDDPVPAPSPASSASGFVSRASSNSCGQSTPKVRAPFARVRSNGPSSENVGPSSFELVKLLGKGSFGEVFHVKHKGTEQEYAMKVLQKSRIMSSNLLPYAKTERNVLAYVQHPYIVRLHYAFQTANHLVLVLQYCPRGNLQQLIRREQKMQEPISRLYTSEILLALIHLHDRKTLFRDLKPENVVLMTRTMQCSLTLASQRRALRAFEAPSRFVVQ